MSKRRTTRRTTQASYVEETVVINNCKAMQEGPKKKRWSRHDLRSVKPLTPAQSDMFEDFFQGFNICATGSAGAGKSFIGVYLALTELLKEDAICDKIIIVRSAVPVRDVGFLPGSFEEKIAVYEQPYKDIFAELLGKYDSYDNMKEAGKVKFWPTSYVRGLTWDNAVVIVDEVQNMTFQEIHSIMTRVGNDSRVIVLGDSHQTDLHKKDDKSGFQTMIEAVKKMSNTFSVIEFSHHDIVRSNFVKSWIMATM